MLIAVLGIGGIFLAAATLLCAAFRTQADRDMVRSLRGEPCEFIEPTPAHYDANGNFHRAS